MMRHYKKLISLIIFVGVTTGFGLVGTPNQAQAICVFGFGSTCASTQAQTTPAATTPTQTTMTPTVTPNTSGAVCIYPNEPTSAGSFPMPSTGCPSGTQLQYNGQQASQTNGNLPNYVPLEPIPGLNQTGNANFGQLLSQLFKVLIILGALIAVGSFVYAGIMYMLRDSPIGVQDAQKRLTAALWGLLLLVGAWVILFTINPQLVTFGGGLNPQTGNFYTTPQQAQLTPIQQDIVNCTNSGGTPTYTTAPSGSGFTTCDDRTFMQKYFSFTDCRPMSSGGVCLVGRGAVINNGLQNTTVQN